MEQSLIQKYGGIGASSKQILNKMKNTIQETYNGNYQQTKNYKEKCKQTNIKKYGAEHFMQTEIGKIKYLQSRTYDKNFKNKCKENIKNKQDKMVKYRLLKQYDKFVQSLNNYWFPLFSADEYKGVNHEYKYRFKCGTCNNEFECSIFNFKRDGFLICPYCKETTKSMIQHQFAEEIKQLKSNLIVQEEKTEILSGRKQLDIFLPEYNLAVEYNGNVWHTHELKQDEQYHFSRFKQCVDKDIKYIAFWSDEYLKYKQYILNIILGLITENTVQSKIQLVGSICKQYNKNWIFFSKVKTSEYFLIFEQNDFLLVFKVKNNEINDVYCSDWTMIYLFEFDLNQFLFKIDNRFKCLFDYFLINENAQIESSTEFYKFDTKRSLTTFKQSKTNCEKIYSYGITHYK